jgi:hypothetical protein
LNATIVIKRDHVPELTFVSTTVFPQNDKKKSEKIQQNVHLGGTTSFTTNHGLSERNRNETANQQNDKTFHVNQIINANLLLHHVDLPFHFVSYLRSNKSF